MTGKEYVVVVVAAVCSIAAILFIAYMSTHGAPFPPELK